LLDVLCSLVVSLDVGIGICDLENSCEVSLFLSANFNERIFFLLNQLFVGFCHLQVVKMVRGNILLVHIFWSLALAYLGEVRHTSIEFFKSKLLFVEDVVDNMGPARVICIHIACFLDEIRSSSNLIVKWIRVSDCRRFSQEL
jgi:hypothetical protein